MSRGRYSPLNPVCYGTTSVCPGNSQSGSIFSATVGNNAELFREVAQLWITPQDIVVDATFGKGVFWKFLPGLPHHAFDKLTGQDLSSLPLEDGSVDVLVLDPPYRPTHGSCFTPEASLNGLSSSYQLGSKDLDTINDVINLYSSGIAEAYRVLRPRGRILVKCQDLSYGHRLHLVSLDILNEIIEVGFDFADQFIMVNKSKLISSRWKKQERARRNHSILWVGIKN